MGSCTWIVVCIAVVLPLLISNFGDGRIRNFYSPCLDAYFNPLKDGCRAPVYTAADIPDQSGKVAIVTGANTGIGKETARELARKNAHVIVAARNPSKGEAAVNDIKQDTSSSTVEYMQLDLASVKSIDAFVDAFKAKHKSLHLLINNAGVMACPFSLTKDQIEMQFGVNHLGHFRLTTSLLDTLKKTSEESSAPSRVINLSSAAHFIPEFFGGGADGVDFDDVLEASKSTYKPWLAYGRSKLANVLFSQELAKRSEGKVLVHSVHPGGVATDLQRHVSGPAGSISSFVEKAFRPILLKPLEGALTTLYAATAEKFETEWGRQPRYFVPIALEHPVSTLAKNTTLQTDLWSSSEKLIKKITGAL